LFINFRSSKRELPSASHDPNEVRDHRLSGDCARANYFAGGEAIVVL